MSFPSTEWTRAHSSFLDVKPDTEATRNQTRLIDAYDFVFPVIDGHSITVKSFANMRDDALAWQ